MGAEAQERSERDDTGSAGFRTKKIFARNTGVCVEEAVGIGLNLGCGKCRWPGWINVDSVKGADIVCDIRKLPLPAEYADAVCAIHVAEHFPSWELPAVLGEWKRVLKVGGKLILELPSLNKIVSHSALAIHSGKAISWSMLQGALFGEQDAARPEMSHRYCYLEHELVNTVTKAGFRNAQIVEARYHFPHRDMRLEAVK